MAENCGGAEGTGEREGGGPRGGGGGEELLPRGEIGGGRSLDGGGGGGGESGVKEGSAEAVWLLWPLVGDATYFFITSNKC